MLHPLATQLCQQSQQQRLTANRGAADTPLLVAVHFSASAVELVKQKVSAEAWHLTPPFLNSLVTC